jgi:hypothetical protein
MCECMAAAQSGAAERDSADLDEQRHAAVAVMRLALILCDSAGHENDSAAQQRPESGGSGKDTDGALYLAKSEWALAAELVQYSLLSALGWSHLDAFERGMIQPIGLFAGKTVAVYEMVRGSRP